MTWQGFINIRLQQEHRKQIKALAKGMKPNEAFDKLNEWADDGYKVTVSRDHENGATIISLTGNGDGPNSGYTMSQRHVDPIVAVAAMVFAHEELAQRGAWEDAQLDWRNDEW